MHRIITSKTPSLSFPSLLLRSFSANATEGGIASAAAVKKLREASGAPLMDCKQALLQPSVQGDLQKAIDWLRAKGIAKATKGNRETKEGLIGIFQDSRQITLVEVNCETDFVAMNQDFQRFVASVGESVHHRGKEIATTTSFSGEEVLKLTPVSTLSSSLFASSAAQKEHGNLQEKLGDVISSIRENIVIRRAKTIFATSAQPNHHTVLSSYLHGKISSISSQSTIQLGRAAGVLTFDVSKYENSSVSFEAFEQQFSTSVARRLAMHLVASKPLFLSKKDATSAFLESEKAIFLEQMGDSDKKKPKEVQDRILQGKLNKRLGDVCLLDQAHVAEEGSPVVHKFLQTYATSQKCVIDVQNFDLWTLNA